MYRILFIALIALGCGDAKHKNYGGNSTIPADPTDLPSGEEDQTKKDTPKKDDNKKDKKEDEKDVDDQIDTPIVEIVTNMGLRNFDQVNATMARLTGVSSQNAQVATAFNDLKVQLPDNNSIKEVTPAKISAITKLGATYCDEMMGDAGLRSQTFPSVNFNQGPNQALADSSQIAMDILIKFWGFVPSSEEQASIANLMGEMANGKPNNTTTTRNVLMGVCTSVIASTPVILF